MFIRTPGMRIIANYNLCQPCSATFFDAEE